jgi:hypothetical protein
VLLGAAATCLTLIVAPVVAFAADPSPSPVVFPQPHYLVFMESHQTYDGPREDNAYWLYPYLPDDGTHFVVPDGSGGVFHYVGSVVGGPFATDDEACPQMIALGIPSLSTWTTHAGESPLVVDCAGFRATPEPTSESLDPAPSGVAVTEGAGGTDAPGTDDEPDAESLGIAVAIIGLLLFGGGALGAVIGGRGAPTVDVGPSPVSTADTPREPPPDPCADQATAVDQASLRGRYLNSLLATGRQYEAIIQKEIDVLANLTLPGSVLLDLGFLAGSLSSGVGPKIIATEGFWKGLAEAVTKDVVKDLAKQSLSPDAIEAWTTAGEGGLSAAKQTLLSAVKESIVNKRFFNDLSPATPVKVFRDQGSYMAFTKELDGFADRVAGPVADGIGALLDLYSGVIDGLALKDRLDNLRSIRDRISDEQTSLEIAFEDALDRHRFAADRLAHCRRINSPDWRP